MEIKGLSAAYGAVHVLHGVALHVAPGEIVSVIGANGAGKSTLLRTVTGLVSATQGIVSVSGRDMSGASPGQLLQAGVALVPEGRQLFGSLTVRENLRMGEFLVGRGRSKWRSRVLELFPVLGERLGQRAGTLSGGEQQMLAIARGLMSEPSLLMLDEPSLGLAPVLVDQVFEAVTQLRHEGVAILLVEQNVAQALAASDRGYVLETGKIRLAGAARELLESPEIQTAYLGL